ncbi:hypothetical protein MMC13_001195 [Lambiella insularis]|nr:hypothetical protein [Lambiella insularis]
MASAEFNISSSLEGLQTDEQRSVLDTVAQIRKCGLETVLSLPQLVVCGDQSAGKSSVLEALTEISFPVKENLATRFATEIILRRAASDSLSVKVIPDTERSAKERETIEEFHEFITDFGELPDLINKAMTVMGLGDNSNPANVSRAFAKDVLSIVIEGPSRQELTVVDLPGLIQTQTKGVSNADVKLVAEITDHYISQPRTICLAVISATNDVANQIILTKVRKVDPHGDRTLGIITKPDRLYSGSDSEQGFIKLACNDNVFLKLGWHVLRNRSFEESGSSFLDRNAEEASYFRRSNFKVLPKDCVGIDTLRTRLSRLLFAHVKRELPKLREDLDEALAEARTQLNLLGNRRATLQDCRFFMARLSLEFYEVCKAAVNGHYEGDYFNQKVDKVFSITSAATIRRLRAVVQHVNTQFSNELRSYGHKYYIFGRTDDTTADDSDEDHHDEDEEEESIDDDDERGSASSNRSGASKRDVREDTTTVGPSLMNRSKALKWVSQVIVRTRGRELSGNFNPLVIGELFWEQSSPWQRMAAEHMEKVALICTQFLRALLEEKCPRDMRSRCWASVIQDALAERRKAALLELNLLVKDLKNYPINYNHYYTDTITKQRRERDKKALTKCIEDGTTTQLIWNSDAKKQLSSTTVDAKKIATQYSQHIDPNMKKHSCVEALDCMFAIYKVPACPDLPTAAIANSSFIQVMQKTFVANVTTQVVERHIVHGLEDIFSPITVTEMSDKETETIASEPASAKMQRKFLEDRIEKLEKGQMVLRDVVASSTL